MSSMQSRLERGVNGPRTLSLQSALFASGSVRLLSHILWIFYARGMVGPEEDTFAIEVAS
jgi:hypothetical protein